MDSETADTVFVVVEVQAGVAVAAACFASRSTAERRAEIAMREHDANDDDVQVFETKIQRMA